MASTVIAPGDSHALDRWGALASIGLALATFAIYWPDVAALWARWSESGPSNLVLFVGPLLPWLIWRQRESIRFDAQAPLGRAAVALGVLGLGWAFASAAHVDIVRQALLPAMAWSAIWGLIGASAARAALFPLAWTGCAVMVWEWLTPSLQLATAKAAPVLVRMVGIPAHIDGNFVSVPAGTFEVAAGCSGLNFFMVAVTLSLLYGHLHEWRIGRRLAFIAVAILTAVAFNWIRVAIIISIGQFSDMQSPLVFHHVLFGWCLYALALIGLALLAARWSAALPPVQHSQPPRGATPALRTVSGRAAITLTLLAFPPVLASIQEKRVDAALAATGVALPASAGRWEGPVDRVFDWHPEYPGASDVARGVYHYGELTIGVDISYFARQQSGMKLVASTSRPAGGEGWVIVDQAEVPLDDVTGAPRAVREIHIHAPGDIDWLIWQWYQIGDAASPSALRTKLHEGLRVFGATSASASVSAAFRCRGNCGDNQARSALASFLTANGRALAAAAAGRPVASGRPDEPRDER